jgi:GAF domain-containing protein
VGAVRYRVSAAALNRCAFCPTPATAPKEPIAVPELKAEAIALGRDERLQAILRDICAATGMGFAAVARVTEQRWIACLVEDRIEFGLDPGDELKIHETICDEIRDSGEAIVIDDVSDDIKWSRHPVPVIYGFKSYCAFPVYLDDGTFFGTLCAIDPAPRRVTDEAVVEMFSTYAKTVGLILSEALARAPTDG